MDEDSNSPTNSEWGASCNDMNLPFMNAESFYIGTSDHSTESDNSLYQEELWQIARDFSDVGSPEEFRVAQLAREAEQMWLGANNEFGPPPCPPSGQYEFLPVPKSIPQIRPRFSGGYLPASSWEPAVLDPTLQWTSEGTIQVKAPTEASPSSGYDPQPGMKSGAPEPADNMAGVVKIGQNRNAYVVKKRPFVQGVPATWSPKPPPVSHNQAVGKKKQPPSR